MEILLDSFLCAGVIAENPSQYRLDVVEIVDDVPVAVRTDSAKKWIRSRHGIPLVRAFAGAATSAKPPRRTQGKRRPGGVHRGAVSKRGTQTSRFVYEDSVYMAGTVHADDDLQFYVRCL
jgi:hypothetical protein